MAKQARSVVTRQAILRGAAEVFDRYGYAGASLSDIITRVGVTKGALYFHFASKEQLAVAVVERQHELSTKPARTLIDSGGSALESIIRLSQLLATQLIDDVLVRAGIRLTLEQGTFGTLPSDPYRDWVGIIDRLFEQSITEGEVHTNASPQELARFVVSSFTGIQLLSHVFTGRADLRERIVDMWKILLPSLVPNRKLSHYLRVAAVFPQIARSESTMNGLAVS